MRTAAALPLLALVLGSCAPFRGVPFAVPTRDFERQLAVCRSAADRCPPLAPAAADVRRTLLIADTQFSNPFGHRKGNYMKPWQDAFVSVAIRPPQIDSFGDQLLRVVLQHEDKADLIIHLGDAGNISCSGEQERFTTAMNEDLRPWFVAPGNHDSLYMGITAYLDTSAAQPSCNQGFSERNAKFWSCSCEGHGRPMAKNAFMSHYINALRHKTPALPLPEKPPEKEEAAVEAQHDKLGPGPLQRLFYHLQDPTHQWGSFVLQQIALDRAGDTVLILLDTTDFAQKPDFQHRDGSISQRQADRVRAWLSNGNAKRVLLAGHHPIEDMNRAAQRRLAALIHDFPIASYLSAHTHDFSGVRYHPDRDQPSRAFLEVNLGSLVDWPMHAATLSVPPGAAPVSLTVTALPTWLDDALCRAHDKSSDGAKRWIEQWDNNYVDDADRHYQASQLRTLKRLLQVSGRSQALPLFSQIEGASGFARPGEQLLQADRLLRQWADRTTLRDYGACQVRWASEAEYWHHEHRRTLKRTHPAEHPIAAGAALVLP